MGRKPSPPDKNPTPHWSISGLILGGLCVCASEWVIAYSVPGGHPAKLIPTKPKRIKNGAAKADSSHWIKARNPETYLRRCTNARLAGITASYSSTASRSRHAFIIRIPV